MSKQNKQDLSFLDYIVDKYGSDFVVSEKPKEVETISTGSVSLDFSLGVRGIPLGRITEIDGPESVGKSTLALGIASNFIKHGHKVLYVDAENTMSYDYINALIESQLSSRDIILVQPKTAEQAFEISEKGIQSNEFKLIIFDSIGGLAPQKEQEDAFTDANVALIPRLLSKFLRRNSFDIRNNNVAFLFLNQIRDNIGSYVKSYTLPGGHALKHFCSIMISLSKGEQIKFGDEVVGVISRFTVKKNKLAPPFRSFYLPIIFGKGIDTYRDLVEFGVTMGVLQKGGAYIKYKDETIGRGVANTIEYFQNNPDKAQSVINDLFRIAEHKDLVEDEEITLLTNDE